MRDPQCQARRRSYGEAGRRLADRQAAGEQDAAIVQGSLADLDRSGDGWWIECDRSGRLAGFLDGQTGQLVLAWLENAGP